MSYQKRQLLDELTYGKIYAAMTRRERLIYWLAAINFVAFVSVSLVIGGDALNGSTREGHYYLSQKGTLTEVNRVVFLYSLIHTLSLFVTFPLAVAIGFKARRRVRERIEA